MDVRIKKLYDEVKRLEDYYQNLSFRAMEENNIPAMMVHQAESAAFTRCRWMIEEAITNDN